MLGKYFIIVSCYSFSPLKEIFRVVLHTHTPFTLSVFVLLLWPTSVRGPVELPVLVGDWAFHYLLDGPEKLRTPLYFSILPKVEEVLLERLFPPFRRCKDVSLFTSWGPFSTEELCGSGSLSCFSQLLGANKPGWTGFLFVYLWFWKKRNCRPQLMSGPS